LPFKNQSFNLILCSSVYEYIDNEFLFWNEIGKVLKKGEEIIVSLPIKVYAESITSSKTDIVDSDNVNITLRFDDGSLGIISYVALGDTRLGKERVEIFGDNSTVVIDNFRKVELYKNRKVTKVKSRGKGHGEEVQASVSALKEGNPSPIPFESLVLTTLTTVRIKESLRKNLPIDVSYPQEIKKNCES